ncbi:MAG: YegS/Rv2252/BmrU family lipid kinase [Flavobacteriales bacterium]
MKTVVIVNGISKHYKSFTKQLAGISRIDRVLTTKASGEAEKMARDSIDAELELLIIAGGDGTLNEVINGILGSDSRAPMLAICPIGSANDYARNLNTQTIEQLIESALEKKCNAVDAISIRSGNRIRYLCNVSAAGIGAEIAATVNARRFRMNATWNYYSAILRWLSSYRAPLVKIKLNELEITQRCFLAAIGKGTYAGNGLGLLPQVGLSDGMLGLTIAGNINVFDFLMFQGRLKKAKRIIDPRVQYLSAKRIELEVLDGTLAIDADGEYQFQLAQGESAVFEILPSVLKLINKEA